MGHQAAAPIQRGVIGVRRQDGRQELVLDAVVIN